MERHALDEAGAFQMLRDHARRMQSTLVDTAQSIVDGTLRTENAEASS
jgi:AmiR/NasT family two-component response regulator